METTLRAPARVPATLPEDRFARVTLAAVRIGVAFMWIENVGWKRPPDFRSLHAYTVDAVTKPVFGPFAWLVQHVVLPHFTFFA